MGFWDFLETILGIAVVAAAGVLFGLGIATAAPVLGITIGGAAAASGIAIGGELARIGDALRALAGLGISIDRGRSSSSQDERRLEQPSSSRSNRVTSSSRERGSSTVKNRNIAPPHESPPPPNGHHRQTSFHSSSWESLDSAQSSNDLPPPYVNENARNIEELRRRQRKAKKHVLDGSVGNTTENNIELLYSLRGANITLPGSDKVKTAVQFHSILVNLGDKISTRISCSESGFNVENGNSTFRIDEDFLKHQKFLPFNSIVKSESKKRKLVTLDCSLYKNGKLEQKVSFQYRFSPNELKTKNKVDKSLVKVCGGQIENLLLRGNSMYNDNGSIKFKHV